MDQFTMPNALSKQEITHVCGGRMIVPVSVDGQPGYTVDWDRLMMDIFMGNISVTVK